jgi:hypothetical protein
VVTEDPGVAVAGALLVVAFDLTDRRVDVEDETVLWPGPQCPGSPQGLCGHLVELTNMTESNGQDDRVATKVPRGRSTSSSGSHFTPDLQVGLSPRWRAGSAIGWQRLFVRRKMADEVLKPLGARWVRFTECSRVPAGSCRSRIPLPGDHRLLTRLTDRRTA